MALPYLSRWLQYEGLRQKKMLGGGGGRGVGAVNI